MHFLFTGLGLNRWTFNSKKFKIFRDQLFPDDLEEDLDIIELDIEKALDKSGEIFNMFAACESIIYNLQKYYENKLNTKLNQSSKTCDFSLEIQKICFSMFESQYSYSQ